MFRSAICIFFLFISTFLFSQEPKYVHYTTDNGLPSSEVYDILQDSKGYMWFATDNGVSRFDGYKFHNYTLKDGLLSRVIFDMFEDYKGRIWFAHDNNQLCYFFNDSITTYKYNQNIASQIKPQIDFDDYITQIVVDSADNILLSFSRFGTLYISNQGKSNKRFLYESNTACHFYSPEFKLSYIVIPQILTAKIYFRNWNIVIYNNSYPLGQQFNFFHETSHLNKDEFAFSFGSNIYVYKNKSLNSIKTNSLRILHLSYENNNLWVGTHPFLGALCFKNADITKPPIKNYLKGHSVSDIYRDNEYGLWLSTIDDGVYYIPNENFQNHTVTTGLTDNQCTELLVNNEKVIFASINKKDIYKIENNIITKINKVPLSLTGKLFYYNDLLWIYTINGIYTYNKKNELLKKKSFIRPYANRTYAISNRIHLIAAADGYNYYINQNKALLKKNCDKSYLKVYISDLCKYKHNQVLASTRNGLYAITPDTINYTSTQYKYLGDQNSKLKARIDRIIYNEFDHKYWMATKEYGVYVWDDIKDTVYTISTAEGLPDNLITSICYSDSIVFVGTKFGLCQITLNDATRFSYSLKMFTVNNGLAANEINAVVVVDSTVYVATDKGICYFNFIQNITNTVPPPVYITNLKINEKDTLILNGYHLKYNQNNLTIQFVGLAYKACGDILYKFQLEGSDTTWHYTKNTELRYLKLTPGKYKFKVLAQNEDGYWSSNPAIINFRILPPFWATLWFKITVLLLIALLVFIAIGIKLNIIKKRDQIKLEETEKRHGLENELMNTRLKALNQQMNPHFVFNTLSAVQLLVLKNENELVMEYLNKFARIMRMTLDFSRNEFSSIERTIEYISAYIKLKSINLNEEINFNLKISDNIDIHKENISPMIVQPFVENAIIHGLIPRQQNMQLLIEIYKEKDNILFIIEDNGIGRTKAAELNKKREVSHRSYGIQITEERIELINKIINKNIKTEIIDLTDDKGNNLGTRVVLNFPNT